MIVGNAIIATEISIVCPRPIVSPSHPKTTAPKGAHDKPCCKDTIAGKKRRSWIFGREKKPANDDSEITVECKIIPFDNIADHPSNARHTDLCRRQFRDMGGCFSHGFYPVVPDTTLAQAIA